MSNIYIKILKNTKKLKKLVSLEVLRAEGEKGLCLRPSSTEVLDTATPPQTDYVNPLYTTTATVVVAEINQQSTERSCSRSNPSGGESNVRTK